MQSGNHIEHESRNDGSQLARCPECGTASGGRLPWRQRLGKSRLIPWAVVSLAACIVTLLCWQSVEQASWSMQSSGFPSEFGELITIAELRRCAASEGDDRIRSALDALAYPEDAACLESDVLTLWKAGSAGDEGEWTVYGGGIATAYRFDGYSNVKLRIPNTSPSPPSSAGFGVGRGGARIFGNDSWASVSFYAIAVVLVGGFIVWHVMKLCVWLFCMGAPHWRAKSARTSYFLRWRLVALLLLSSWFATHVALFPDRSTLHTFHNKRLVYSAGYHPAALTRAELRGFLKQSDGEVQIAQILSRWLGRPAMTDYITVVLADLSQPSRGYNAEQFKVGWPYWWWISYVQSGSATSPLPNSPALDNYELHWRYNEPDGSGSWGSALNVGVVCYVIVCLYLTFQGTRFVQWVTVERRLRHRERRGQCFRCGYSLRNGDSVVPSGGPLS